MRKLAVIFLMISFALHAQTAETIIDNVDANQLFSTYAFEGKMEIYQNSRKLIKEFSGFAKKKGERSIMTFSNPEDRNVKYLRIEDELWIYFPKADDILKISGHMLKQGMMGSDISYEDMLETEKLSDIYSFKLLPDEQLNDTACFVVELTAKKNNAKYAVQKLFIEKKHYVPVKIELYAKGNRLIKEMTQSDIRNISGRWVPYRIEIRDVRKKNTRTIIYFTKLSYDINISDTLFSKQNLRK